MATTLRLAPDLETRAKGHAASIGVSLNALVAVALDAYLRPCADAPGTVEVAPAPALPPAAHPAPAAQPGPPATASRRPGKAKKKGWR